MLYKLILYVHHLHLNAIHVFTHELNVSIINSHQKVAVLVE